MFFLFKCNSYSKLDFSESASSNFDGIYLFNSNLLFIIINIVLFVWWILIVISLNFFDFISFEKKNFTHNNNIEIVWTTIPALILLSISSPSFSLLYSLDEIVNPDLTIKIIGHQWYWTYEISDYNFCFSKKKN